MIYRLILFLLLLVMPASAMPLHGGGGSGTQDAMTAVLAGCASNAWCAAGTRTIFANTAAFVTTATNNVYPGCTPGVNNNAGCEGALAPDSGLSSGTSYFNCPNGHIGGSGTPGVCGTTVASDSQMSPNRNFIEWCSGAQDTILNRGLFGACGGHTAFNNGSEVYSFDFATLLWHRLTTPVDAYTEIGFNGMACYGAYPNSHGPTGQHEYGGLQFIPTKGTKGTLWETGAAGNCPSGGNATGTVTAGSAVVSLSPALTCSSGTACGPWDVETGAGGEALGTIAVQVAGTGTITAGSVVSSLAVVAGSASQMTLTQPATVSGSVTLQPNGPPLRTSVYYFTTGALLDLAQAAPYTPLAKATATSTSAWTAGPGACKLHITTPSVTAYDPVTDRMYGFNGSTSNNTYLLYFSFSSPDTCVDVTSQLPSGFYEDQGFGLARTDPISGHRQLWIFCSCNLTNSIRHFSANLEVIDLTAPASSFFISYTTSDQWGSVEPGVCYSPSRDVFMIWNQNVPTSLFVVDATKTDNTGLSTITVSGAPSTSELPRSDGGNSGVALRGKLWCDEVHKALVLPTSSSSQVYVMKYPGT